MATQLEVSYSLPLRRAWRRTKRNLFGPVDPGKWLTVGFAAWLSGLGGGAGTGAEGSWRLGKNDSHGRTLEWILDSPVWIMVGLVVVALLLVAAVVLLWLSSRAKFVFLYDVARERAAIAEPWKEYRVQGNSLFLWRLGFLLVALAGAAILLAPGLLLVLATSFRGGGLSAALSAAALLLGALATVIPVAYVQVFLDSFVVPLMFRNRLTASDAWRSFLPLLRRNAPDFLIYGLFLLALAVGVVVTVVVAGLATCCVGFVLLSIPYLGSVILLPVSFTYRAFGPEFLAQYGPEYRIWSSPEEPASSS